MKKTLKRIISIVFFEKVFFHFFFLNILKRNLKNTYKILELGAGRYSYLKQIDNSLEITAIDLFEPSIQYAKENKIYDYYIKGNVNKLTDYIPPKSFDAVVAFDLIEHLSKEDGLRLINNMIIVAKQQIIIYTPNGFLPQPSFNNNPFQEHISGWTYDEMKNMGFKVFGINGYKRLRKMYAEPVIKPNLIGNFISNISTIFLKLFHKEDLSFAILCIKDI